MELILILIGRMDKTKDPTIGFLQETHLRYKDTNRLKVKRMEKHIPSSDQRRVGVPLI